MIGNIFKQDVRLDTQTAFLANGNINIYPCPWEADRVPISTTDGRASYRGRIRVEKDGRTRVTRYNTGLQGPLFTTLFETEHCRVLLTPRGKIIERWNFPPALTADEIRTIRALEGAKVDGFYTSRKLETRW